jgi:hypothetical protein
MIGLGSFLTHHIDELQFGHRVNVQIAIFSDKEQPISGLNFGWIRNSMVFQFIIFQGIFALFCFLAIRNLILASIDIIFGISIEKFLNVIGFFQLLFGWFLFNCWLFILSKN